MDNLQIPTDNPADIALITTLAKIAASTGRKSNVNLHDIPKAIDRIALATYLLISDSHADFGSQNEWKLLSVHLRRLAQEIETTIIQPSKPKK